MKKRQPTPSNIIAHAKMVAALMADPHTTDELIEETGLSRRSLGRHIIALRAEGICYVHHWEQTASGQFNIPSHMIGRSKDAKRPRKSQAERSREKRAKVAMRRMLAALRGEVTA